MHHKYFWINEWIKLHGSFKDLIPKQNWTIVFGVFLIWFHLLCSLSHLKWDMFLITQVDFSYFLTWIVLWLLLQYLTTDSVVYNNTHLLSHWLVGQKSHWAPLSFLLRVSQGWNQGTCWTGSFWRLWVKNLSPYSCKLLAEFSCSQLQDRGHHPLAGW